MVRNIVIRKIESATTLIVGHIYVIASILIVERHLAIIAGILGIILLLTAYFLNPKEEKQTNTPPQPYVGGDNANEQHKK